MSLVPDFGAMSEVTLIVFIFGWFAALLIALGYALCRAAKRGETTRLDWEAERAECEAREEDAFVARVERYHARQAERVAAEAQEFLAGVGQ